MIALALIGLAAVAALLLEPAGKPIAGRPDVIDGDTLRFGSARVRLLGLDAPELDQTCTDRSGTEWACGAAARSFVAGAVAAGTTQCEPSGRDRYGRTLARCTVDGGDLGRAIVEAGWAVPELDYAVFSTGARLAGRGIWGGRFDDPAVWRRTHGTEQPGFWEWIRAWFQ